MREKFAERSVFFYNVRSIYMFELRDLLKQAVQRSRISTQVTAAQIVSTANDILRKSFLTKRPKDGRVVSYRDETLTLEVRNSSASQFLHEQELSFIKELRESIPDVSVRQIRYRVVGQFKRSEL